MRRACGNEYEVADEDNNWEASEWNNSNNDNAILDAHWGAMKDMIISKIDTIVIVLMIMMLRLIAM